MTPQRYRLPASCLLPVFLLLGACSTSPERGATSPPSADYHLLIGELALLRDKRDIAAAEYAAAAERVDDAAIARRATLIALHAGDIAAARRAAARWEQLAPADLEAAQYRGMLLARAGRMEAALGYLLRVVDGGSGEAAVIDTNLRALTTLLAGEPNPWRAADLMAAIAHARPSQPAAWEGAALLALEADRPDRAAGFAGRALELDRSLREAAFLRARAELVQWPAPDADAVLAPVAGLRESEDPGERFRYAGLLVLAGRDAEADALYEDLLLGNPDQHDARLARALLALDGGRHDTAEDELHELVRRQGHVQQALYFLGELAERRGRLDDAVDWYARVAPGVPRWMDAQLGIARVLLEVDGADAAQVFFARLREHWPEQRLVLVLNEASLLTGSGHAERAVNLLDATTPASALDRLNLDGQLALATAAAGQGRRAETLFRRLLRDDPGNAFLQGALGSLLLERGREREAAELLDAAHAAAPADAAVLDATGWLRYRQGRAGDARPLLEESWQREPAPGTGLHLLAVLLELGAREAAERLSEEIHARFPDAHQTGDAR